MVIFFPGYGQMERQADRQTDRQTETVLESSYGNMSAHKKSRIQFRTFLKKKIKFFGSHVVVLVKTFPLTYQLLM